MKFINIRHLLLITIYLLLLSGCKRVCQDERADNFGEEPRKDGCNYSYADNWHEDIIVDSLVLNGNKVELLNEYGSTFIPSGFDDEFDVYYNGGQNYYSSTFEVEKFIEDTLHNVEFTISLPVASNYQISEGDMGFSLTYLNSQNEPIYYEFNEEFNFIKEKQINGYKYYTYNYKILNIKDDVLITSNNFHDIYIYLSMGFEVFGVDYKILFKKEI